MNVKKNSIQQLLGQMDIYLVDQIMKGRYNEKDSILDAGCGSGRNLDWFLTHNIDVYGIDADEESINFLKNKYPLLPEVQLQVAQVEQIPFADNHFNHVISSAVLHFAKNTAHFQQMIIEMVRVLKFSGTMFIRMTSNIGIEQHVKLVSDGVYRIPDGSTRFLLTKALLAQCMAQSGLTFLEPLKTVNVADFRCMSTLLLQKN